ncbi:hypothetical protein TYRP_011780 [Tyrophagus putrescentiae]|nr:hypothetical protein TYRP_011780 [Tyrophagus putrescentiae]
MRRRPCKSNEQENKNQPKPAHPSALGGAVLAEDELVVDLVVGELGADDHPTTEGGPLAEGNLHRQNEEHQKNDRLGDVHKDPVRVGQVTVDQQPGEQTALRFDADAARLRGALRVVHHVVDVLEGDVARPVHQVHVPVVDVAILGEDQLLGGGDLPEAVNGVGGGREEPLVVGEGRLLEDEDWGDGEVDARRHRIVADVEAMRRVHLDEVEEVGADDEAVGVPALIGGRLVVGDVGQAGGEVVVEGDRLRLEAPAAVVQDEDVAHSLAKGQLLVDVLVLGVGELHHQHLLLVVDLDAHRGEDLAGDQRRTVEHVAQLRVEVGEERLAGELEGRRPIQADVEDGGRGEDVEAAVEDGEGVHVVALVQVQWGVGRRLDVAHAEGVLPRRPSHSLDRASSAPPEIVTAKAVRVVEAAIRADQLLHRALRLVDAQRLVAGVTAGQTVGQVAGLAVAADDGRRRRLGRHCGEGRAAFRLWRRRNHLLDVRLQRPLAAGADEAALVELRLLVQQHNAPLLYQAATGGAAVQALEVAALAEEVKVVGC